MKPLDIATLQNYFPATAGVIGSDALADCLAVFAQQAEPSITDFPTLAADQPAAKNYLYLEDLAKLECLTVLSSDAPMLPPMTATELGQVDDPVNLKLPVQPHVFILRSAWPIDEIWHMLAQSPAQTPPKKIGAKETFIAVFRDAQQEDSKVSVWPLSEGAYKFIEHLMSEPVFAFAADTALRAEADLPLDIVLMEMVDAKLFSSSAL
jgi:hypothetical protein